MKYHLVQLGCQMNQADGERIGAVLSAMGYTKTDNEEDAQLLGVVACSVRQKAIDKVYSKIDKWNDWKSKKHLLTFVSGCVLDADREKFLDRFDLVFGVSELPQLPSMISEYGVATPVSMDGNKRAFAETVARADHTRVAVREMQESIKLSGGQVGVLERITKPALEPDPLGGFWNIRPDYASSFEAFVPIQNGCDKFCTFCAVPYTRGREVSRPHTEILSEVRDLVERGYRSITLLGQNVNSYGQDRQSREGHGVSLNFAQLLHEIGRIGDEAFQKDGTRFWVYFTSPHPRDMGTDVLEAVASYDCLAKQINLPMQSGDDHVLMRMNRKYGVERYRSVVADIRRILPTATLFTDIIVGFSGETEEQFESTRRAMEEFQYNMAFVAMYSPRPGAASSRWDDDISLDTKKDRLAVLTKILHDSSGAWTRAQIGKTLTVLVDGSDRNSRYLSGRTEGKIQVRFLLPQANDYGAAGSDNSVHAIVPESAEAWYGRFVQVHIESVQDMSMEGSFTAFGFPDGSGAPG